MFELWYHVLVQHLSEFEGFGISHFWVRDIVSIVNDINHFVCLPFVSVWLNHNIKWNICLVIQINAGTEWLRMFYNNPFFILWLVPQLQQKRLIIWKVNTARNPSIICSSYIYINYYYYYLPWHHEL